LPVGRAGLPEGLAGRAPDGAGAGRARVPNGVLRRIRVHERQETRGEFAESMARKAEELRLDQLLAGDSPKAAPATAYHARYLDASERSAKPLAISGPAGTAHE
jgi:hypothetical protein